MFGLLLALTWGGVARAECAWGERKVESAFATMTTVTINGKLFPVKGEAARAAFISALSECGVSPATIAAFQEWRSMRRWTNISGIVGACCFTPALIATPITAVLAGDRKEDLIVLLTTG